MRSEFVALAKKLADEGNHWYVWGAQGPNNFDCSGLVMWLGAQVGRWAEDADTTANGLWTGAFGGERIPSAELEPGDLVLYGSAPNRATHVEIWVGPTVQTIGANGGRSTTTTVAKAKAANAKVKYSKYTNRKDLLGFVRLFPADEPSPWAWGDWHDALELGIITSSKPHDVPTMEVLVAVVMRAYRKAKE